jgi:hypothetical protein
MTLAYTPRAYFMGEGAQDRVEGTRWTRWSSILSIRVAGVALGTVRSFCTSSLSTVSESRPHHLWRNW